MEPDLIGQEKQQDWHRDQKISLAPQWSLTSSVRKSDTRKLPHLGDAGPQWSLTSSVRKSLWITVTLWGDEAPAMEPDLIGQEKGEFSLDGGVKLAVPAMEPDLIGQEKTTSGRGPSFGPFTRNGA